MDEATREQAMIKASLVDLGSIRRNHIRNAQTEKHHHVDAETLAASRKINNAPRSGLAKWAADAAGAQALASWNTFGEKVNPDASPDDGTAGQSHRLRMIDNMKAAPPSRQAVTSSRGGRAGRGGRGGGAVGRGDGRHTRQTLIQDSGNSGGRDSRSGRRGVVPDSHQMIAAQAHLNKSLDAPSKGKEKGKAGAPKKTNTAAQQPQTRAKVKQAAGIRAPPSFAPHLVGSANFVESFQQNPGLGGKGKNLAASMHAPAMPDLKQIYTSENKEPTDKDNNIKAEPKEGSEATVTVINPIVATVESESGPLSTDPEAGVSSLDFPIDLDHAGKPSTHDLVSLPTEQDNVTPLGFRSVNVSTEEKRPRDLGASAHATLHDDHPTVVGENQKPQNSGFTVHSLLQKVKKVEEVAREGSKLRGAASVFTPISTKVRDSVPAVAVTSAAALMSQDPPKSSRPVPAGLAFLNPVDKNAVTAVVPASIVAPAPVMISIPTASQPLAASIHSQFQGLKKSTKPVPAGLAFLGNTKQDNIVDEDAMDIDPVYGPLGSVQYSGGSNFSDNLKSLGQTETSSKRVPRDNKGKSLQASVHNPINTLDLPKARWNLVQGTLPEPAGMKFIRAANAEYDADNLAREIDKLPEIDTMPVDATFVSNLPPRFRAPHISFHLSNRSPGTTWEEVWNRVKGELRDEGLLPAEHEDDEKS